MRLSRLYAYYRHVTGSANSLPQCGPAARRAHVGQPQHQLHQHYYFTLPLLRLLSKGRTHETCAARLTISSLEEVSRRASRRGSAAYQVFLGRQSIPPPRLHRDTYTAICLLIKAAVPGHAHPMPSRRSRTQGAATLQTPCPPSWRSEAGRGWQLARYRAEISTTRCTPSSAPTISTRGAMASTWAARRARASACARPDDHYGPCRDLARLVAPSAGGCATAGQTWGFTELVPLPFCTWNRRCIVMGRARRGLTFREAVIMHSSEAGAASGDHQHPDLCVKIGPAGAGSASMPAPGRSWLGNRLLQRRVGGHLRVRPVLNGTARISARRRWKPLIRSIGREPPTADTLYRPCRRTPRAPRSVPRNSRPIVLTPPRKRVRPSRSCVLSHPRRSEGP